MVHGIAGGLMMGGLISGALLGSLWLLVGFTAAGLLVAGAGTAAEKLRQLRSARRQLGHYPIYRY